ncbi:MAG TPA: nuclear transport factor 2 family protein [Bacteroidota bacterium]|nr:nuclear transport factor 2 family protein [Bacteroidota bacterium]
MRIRLTLLVQFVVIFGAGYVCVRAESDPIANQLAQVEREFSHAAGERGIKAAFLSFFDDDCVAFYPQPANAKKSLIDEPESGAALSWFPVVVEVSASGDFGFTTGPSEYRPGGKTDTTVYYGHFVSVWKKNPEGQWKVVLDVGSGYPKEDKRDEEFTARRNSAREKKKHDSSGSDRSGMMTADSLLSLLATANGNADAAREFYADDVRVYRKGFFPSQSKNRAEGLVHDEKFSRFACYGGRISAAGDLGCTYGIAVGGDSDTSSYIRVWRNEGEWKVVVDVLKPWPSKK